jgi:glyoxylase-like metal-dependent hydrolase (beta-lactamase superfamily II)
MTVQLRSGHLPGWVTWLQAPNPGPMTLDGTNTWLVDDGTVIDPGPADPEHIAAIMSYGPVRRILVTHGHHDHVEGVRLLADRTGAAVGELPDGLELLATPGHTADSVSFVAKRDDVALIFTGDTILGRGSSVVAWPDGNVGAYLNSLDLLAETARSLSGGREVPALPGHGPVLPDCAAAAAWLHGHRMERLAQVKSAVAGGASTPEEVADVVYADVEPGVRFAALWTVRAQLDHLRRVTP